MAMKIEQPKLRNKGFTLMEMMIAIIIFAGISLGISYTFSEIQAYYRQQVFYEDVTNYGNTWADEIGEYIRKAKKITLTSRDGYRVIRVTFPHKNENTGLYKDEWVQFSANSEDGILMDSSVDELIEDWYFKSFKSNTAQYRLEYFWMDPMQAGYGTFSQGILAVHKATFDLEIEIELTTLRKKLETKKLFKFKRRVFAANVFL